MQRQAYIGRIQYALVPKDNLVMLQSQFVAANQSCPQQQLKTTSGHMRTSSSNPLGGFCMCPVAAYACMPDVTDGTAQVLAQPTHIWLCEDSLWDGVCLPEALEVTTLSALDDGDDAACCDEG